MSYKIINGANFANSTEQSYKYKTVKSNTGASGHQSKIAKIGDDFALLIGSALLLFGIGMILGRSAYRRARRSS